MYLESCKMFQPWFAFFFLLPVIIAQRARSSGQRLSTCSQMGPQSMLRASPYLCSITGFVQTHSGPNTCNTHRKKKKKISWKSFCLTLASSTSCKHPITIHTTQNRGILFWILAYSFLHSHRKTSLKILPQHHFYITGFKCR